MKDRGHEEQRGKESAITLHPLQDTPALSARASDHTCSERVRAIRALQGSLADIPLSSDDFARLKQEEIELEEQRFARYS